MHAQVLVIGPACWLPDPPSRDDIAPSSDPKRAPPRPDPPTTLETLSSRQTASPCTLCPRFCIRCVRHGEGCRLRSEGARCEHFSIIYADQMELQKTDEMGRGPLCHINRQPSRPPVDDYPQLPPLGSAGARYGGAPKSPEFVSNQLFDLACIPASRLGYPAGEQAMLMLKSRP